MSLLGVREELADALSTVDGLTGYVAPPRALKPGDAWPRWGGAEQAAGHEFLSTWRVLVLLSTDEQEALAALETLLPDLQDALQPHAHVQSFAPVTYTAAGSSNHPALEITLLRE